MRVRCREGWRTPKAGAPFLPSRFIREASWSAIPTCLVRRTIRRLLVVILFEARIQIGWTIFRWLFMICFRSRIPRCVPDAIPQTKFKSSHQENHRANDRTE